MGWRALRGLLDRPLASYYLLLSSVGLLLVIGLMMVFSVTSVDAYVTTGSPFGSLRQAGDLRRRRAGRVLGLPAAAGAHVPGRRPRRCSSPRSCCMGFVDLMGWLSRQPTRRADVGRSTSGRSGADDLWLHVGASSSSRPSWPSSPWSSGAPTCWSARASDRLRGGSWPCRCCRSVGLLFLLVGYNDLGSMICLLVLFVGLLWAAGARLRVFAAGSGSAWSARPA